MPRLRYTDLKGTIGPSGMTNSATTHTFTAPLTYANGATVPTLAANESFLISVLDPTSGNVAEAMLVTAYNSGTGAATLTRAQEGTSAVTHASGDKVVLAAYPSDFLATGLLYTPPSGVTTIDEFSDGVVGSAWGRVDESGGAARATWVEAGDALSLLLAGSDGAGHIHAQMRAVGTPLAAGDALVTTLHVINATGAVPAATTFPAIIVADGNTSGAGSQIVASLYSGAWQAIVPMTNYQSLGTFTQSSMSFNSAHRLWLRIVKLASNVWRVDWSPNGSQWFTSGNTITNTLVPTYIGIGGYNTLSVSSMITFEAFRRMSGVS